MRPSGSLYTDFRILSTIFHRQKIYLKHVQTKGKKKLQLTINSKFINFKNIETLSHLVRSIFTMHQTLIVEQHIKTTFNECPCDH